MILSFRGRWKGSLQIRFAFVADLGRFTQQVFTIHLQWCEVLAVEFIVVIVTELLAEKFQIVAADDDASGFLHPAEDVGLLVHFRSILMGFVEESETRDFHQVDAVGIFNLDVEVPHDKGGEVEPGHLKQQLVLVERVGMVGQNEQEFFVTVGDELAGGDGVAVVEHNRTSAPYILQVEFASMEFAAGFHTVDNHARHLADAAAGIVFHHGVHVFQTSVGIIVVESAQSSDEDKLVAVGTQRETFLRNIGVAEDFLVTVGLECIVGGGVEGVLYMLAKFGVLHIVWVGEDAGPLTFRIFLLEQVDV